MQRTFTMKPIISNIDIDIPEHSIEFTDSSFDEEDQHLIKPIIE